MRFWDWWEFKTPIFLGVAYMMANAAKLTLPVLWPRLVIVVAALIPVATYVSVINEITDLEVDRLASKSNAMEGRSGLFQALWLLACPIGGALALMALRCSPIAAGVYGLNWLAFSLYSIPPVRLKNRGIWGVIADACGGQLLPTLWTVASVLESRAGDIPQGWQVFVGLWAFVLGLRGIIGHQLRDLSADRTSGVNSFVVRLGEERSRRLLSRVLLPLELLAFSGGAALAGAWLPLIALAGAAGIGWKLQRWSPAKVLLTYYLTLFPVAGVVTLAQRDDGVALVLLPLLVLLFPGCWGLSRERLRDWLSPEKD